MEAIPLIVIVIQLSLMVAVLIGVLAILKAIKFGFNEVIKGLEAISARLDQLQ